MFNDKQEEMKVKNILYKCIALALTFIICGSSIGAQAGVSIVRYRIIGSDIRMSIYDQDSISVITVPLDFPLDAWIDTLHQGIRSHHGVNPASGKQMGLRESLANYERMAVLLYAKLVAPIDSLLREEVIINADGVLATLPFEVLLSKAPRASEYFDTYDFLLLRHRISYTYSVTVLQEMLKASPYSSATKQEMLAVAPFAPTQEGNYVLFPRPHEILRNLRPLPSLKNSTAGKELFELFTGHQLYGIAATEQNFFREVTNHRFLHLATHAVADQNNGILSFLTFRSKQYPDQYTCLLAGQIKNMRMPLEMVLLSSCDTGGGQYLPGDHLVSLGSAFVDAGAKSVFTALWPLDDQAAGLLTKEFYWYLQAGQSKSYALQQAKKNRLEHSRYGHPYFWAAFIGWGDMRPVY
jgi:CHAT domain-containing protein